MISLVLDSDRYLNVFQKTNLIGQVASLSYTNNGISNIGVEGLRGYLLGKALSSGTGSQTVNIDISSKLSGFSNLKIGFKYYVSLTGGVTDQRTSDDLYIGVAISSNTIIRI